MNAIKASDLSSAMSDSQILDHLNTTVLVFDADARLVYINAAGENLFALSSRQAAGMGLKDMLSNGAHLARRVDTARQSNHPVTERELQLCTLDGHEVTVDCTVTPLTAPGQATSVLVEMLAVDRQLRITREENLLSQNQAARDLVRGLAHEIKNPLSGLRGAAQLLERELKNQELAEYTRIIVGEADRLQALMDRMLGPRALPEKKRITIHEVLEHVRSLVKAEGAEKLNIVRDYDPSIPDLKADPDMLIQAVLNIVRNAAQAMYYNGTLTLRTRTQRQFTIGHHRHKLVLRLDIIDTGPGIPPGMMEKIFYPMITGRADGTGLGLTIAQSLVSRHGGLIECVSHPGHTVFTILLPLEPCNE